MNSGMKIELKDVLIIKAIIFDFDGTLANTLPICYYAFQCVFKEFDNIDLSIRRNKGNVWAFRNRDYSREPFNS